ncbi:uncharacterized protein AB675_11645 [Cyphellophora attinorum]|uniref:Uncharacterized protein n=1 Tax=Cyphellophora attinorum TaxID=1664694 RepID=A0A0N1H317_9EURO|nr:uncharacterized protein AB675_11645 [Phialophora attinorum]KPI34662.1 hypothetical protein AB675_11645 [Phialophora attinorum]
MLMDEAAQPGVNAATAVGSATKKLPLATPLTIAKMSRGASDELTGQITSIVRLLTKADTASVLKAPIRSHVHPLASRPAAVAPQKPATNAAPVEPDGPMELAKSGRKNGGTNRANTPITPAIAKARNGAFFKRDQSKRDVCPGIVCYSNSNAVGSPVAMMSRPKTRNVQGMPNLSTIACAANGRTVAPRPPPSLMTPFAVPSLRVNYCRGMLFAAANTSDDERPIRAPAVAKRPPMLSRVKLVTIGPRP